MVLSEVLDLFVEQSPICVMVRATLQNTFSAKRLDDLFARHALRQRPSELLFSTVADLMSLVVCRVRPTMHAAFQARRDEIDVSIKSVYEKLKGIEPHVSRELVRDTAQRMTAIIRQTGGAKKPLLPGYRLKIIDGNHLRRTERRLKPLRTLNAAPLPGHSLVVLDPELMLAVDVFPCEDGHAQERSLFSEVLETIEPMDVILADRNFCTANFLCGTADRGGYFVIRQHAANVPWEPVGHRRRVGHTETGVVYEQAVRIVDAEGEERLLRRITIKLHEPTRDGENAIHVLTNLPAKLGAQRMARLYQQRWTVETAFQEIEATLRGEVETLGYPKAALFAFCLALVSYNVLAVVKAALRGVHGAKKIDDEVSAYYLADEVAGTWRGMMIVLPAEYWEEQYAHMTPSQMARFLCRIAKQARLSIYQKHPRGPKKKPPNKMNKKGRRHVSTAKILAASNNAK